MRADERANTPDMLPTTERPPVRSKVSVVFSLLGGKREVKVTGEVVLHGVSGIGVQAPAPSLSSTR